MIFIQKTKGFIVLLTGPSGVGKDTIIEELMQSNNPLLRRVPQYTDRQLRENELGRIHKDCDEIKKMEKDGKVYVVLNRFNIIIAEPIFEIKNAISEGLIPVMDYNIRNISGFKARIGENVFNVYLTPPSMDEWRRRLTVSGRPERFEIDISELEEVQSGKFSKHIDLMVVNSEVKTTAQIIARAIMQHQVKAG